MNEPELRERVTRLEEQLRAAEKALQLAQNNAHIFFAEITSVVAILVSIFAVLRPR